MLDRRVAQALWSQFGTTEAMTSLCIGISRSQDALYGPFAHAAVAEFPTNGQRMERKVTAVSFRQVKEPVPRAEAMNLGPSESIDSSEESEEPRHSRVSLIQRCIDAAAKLIGATSDRPAWASRKARPRRKYLTAAEITERAKRKGTAGHFGKAREESPDGRSAQSSAPNHPLTDRTFGTPDESSSSPRESNDSSETGRNLDESR